MSSVAVGGTEQEPGPQLKRRRLLDAGGPIEDDETARRKMRDAPVYARGGDENGIMMDSIPMRLSVSGVIAHTTPMVS